MKTQSIKIIYIIYSVLLIIFIVQELFPVLFVLQISPTTQLIAMNYPLTIGVVLILIPIFTARSFIKNPTNQSHWLNLSKIMYVLLSIGSIIVLILPYASLNGIIRFGIYYSIYSVLVGMILILIGFFQIIFNRLHFGFSISLVGTILGFVGYLKSLGYIFQYSSTRLEFGFFIGITIWFLFFILSIFSLFKFQTLNQTT